MSINAYGCLTNELEGRKFESLEEYDDAVRGEAIYMIEEIGKAERWALSHDSEVFNQLDVEIKGVYPDGEEEEDGE